MKKNTLIISSLLLIAILAGSYLLQGSPEDKQQPDNKTSSSISQPEITSIQIDAYNYNADTLSTRLVQNIPGTEEIIQLTSGDSHSLALDKSGKVFASGVNTFGQAGLGDQYYSTWDWIQIPNFGDIKQISASGQHSVALDSQGDIWSWGGNNSGQLGNGTNTKVTTPTKISTDLKAASIATGYRFTLATDASDQLWGWGMNCNQEDIDASLVLGVDPFSSGYYYDVTKSETNKNSVEDCLNESNLPLDTSIPRVIWKAPSKIKKVAAGYGHVVVLLDDGTVYTSGCNLYGQLGREDTQMNDISKRFEKVESLKNIVDVSAGFRHTLALSGGGDLYGFGANNSGQVSAEQANEKITTPQIYTGISSPVVKMFASGDTSFFTDSDSTLKSIGRNPYLPKENAFSPQQLGITSSPVSLLSYFPFRIIQSTKK
jgi:alpha-tubulin suppressor-like RCC1 family protein